jgi:DNA-binding response OmpR family regulator
VGVAAPLFLGDEEQGGSGAEAWPKSGRRLSAVEADGPGAVSGRELTVLLVEDDPAMRLLVSFNLEAAGFRVVAATTGSEGVELAAREQPDVVLLDVMLPDLGGFDVAQRVGGVPVVFVSARVSEADVERGREVGAIDYVTKPFDPLGLAARLQEDLEELGRSGAEGVWRLRFGRGPGRAE